MLKEASLSNSRFCRLGGQKKAAMMSSRPNLNSIPLEYGVGVLIKHWNAVLRSLSRLCREGVGDS
jgi:hypothetical protein